PVAPDAGTSAPGGGGTPESVLAVGGVPAGGRPLGDAALLATGPDGPAYLIWHRRRYPAPDLALVRRAFGWTDQPVTVATAFADALEQGPDLAPPKIPGFGERTGVGQRPVGSVVVVDTQGGARQYAVVLAAGLAPITQVQADLLLSDPDYVRRLGRNTAEQFTQGQYALVPQVSLPGGPGTLPATTPRLLRPSTVESATCAGGADVAVDVPAGVLAGAVATGGGRYADRVLVPPGRGALVASGGPVSLVTDLGVRYPVPTTQAQAALGYPGVSPVGVAAALLALVPAGRSLDPDAARSPASLTD
ncbi:MAG: type VII secretion protein EccB, partial [Micromonosporaceae bacterium]|nr:type VII secretion protein EccB [Micromonosporaceae bacterium]